MSIDKTRAVVKDLHSRILVAIQRIDMISKNIEDLRDKELQPQLEELIGRYIYPFSAIQFALPLAMHFSIFFYDICIEQIQYLTHLQFDSHVGNNA